MSVVDLYPVVHVSHIDQAIDQAALAQKAGADGIYLIAGLPSLDSDYGVEERTDLIETYRRVREAVPNFFIGLNMLGYSSAGAFIKLLRENHRSGLEMPDGLWVDDAWEHASVTKKIRELNPQLFRISYLGGVAFKHTPTYTDRPRIAAREARDLEPFVDVVTTSGPGTASAAPTRKIAAMKAAVGKPLAIASGITVDNIKEFTPYVDQILVASGIETKSYSGQFVPELLFRIVELAHDEK
jgi:predicted TIM-barrel enzyme